ncbi:MAG: hypothetical protein JW844_04510 [Candidatus Omnitrophica bacterium]|nr:hypothetical protein [Candidatus Omnitrophota bacterium]
MPYKAHFITKSDKQPKGVFDDPAKETLLRRACFFSISELADYIYRARHHKVGRYPARQVK